MKYNKSDTTYIVQKFLINRWEDAFYSSNKKNALHNFNWYKQNYQCSLRLVKRNLSVLKESKGTL